MIAKLTQNDDNEKTMGRLTNKAKQKTFPGFAWYLNFKNVKKILVAPFLNFCL